MIRTIISAAGINCRDFSICVYFSKFAYFCSFCLYLSGHGSSCPHLFCTVARLLPRQKSFGFRDFPGKQPVHSLKKADLFEKTLVRVVFQKPKTLWNSGFLNSIGIFEFAGVVYETLPRCPWKSCRDCDPPWWLGVKVSAKAIYTAARLDDLKLWVGYVMNGASVRKMIPRKPNGVSGLLRGTLLLYIFSDLICILVLSS